MKALKFAIILIAGLILAGESMGLMAVSPGTLDYTVMKGEPSLKQFSVINSGEAFNANISISCPDASLNSWFYINPSGFVEIPKESTEKINVTVKASEDIPQGYYTCTISIIPVEEEKSGNKSSEGAGIIVGGSVKVNINVSGDEIIIPKVYETQASDTEVGRPSTFMIKVVNYGSNVKIKPKARFDVMKDGKIIDSLEKTTEGYIPPGSGEEITMSWDTVNITPGNYAVHFEVFIGDKKLDSSGYVLGTSNQKNVTISQDVTFKVYGAGTFTKTGFVSGVKADETMKPGEISEIIVYFKNTGKVEITAKSDVKIYLNDKIVEVLESSPLAISPDETGSLTSYFTKSNEEGLYTVKVKVAYENKVAQFNDTIIKVVLDKNDTVKQEPAKQPPTTNPTPKKDDSSTLFWIAGIIVVIVIIAVILRKMRIL